MKKLMNYAAIAVTMIAFLGGSTLNAQEWTDDQLEVWNTVENLWQKWKVGDFDNAMSNVHADYLGWNNTSPMPMSKEKWEKGMKEDGEYISDQYYDIEPARILVYKNVAVVHYYYSYSYTYNKGEKKQISGKGKWTEFLVMEKNLWMLIGDFTYSEPKK
ncbi:MAG: hypothetical protein C0591_01805 [Marinilabiliales bacterium]|nr:MAG: hypothetical protein C0591_01805 [Marinilabiliales bacterium]